MHRVSSAPEDAFHFKGGFADGWGKITSAKALVFQFPPDKESSRQGPPGLFACLEIQRFNDNAGNQSAEQPSEVLLSIQSANKESGELNLCHPGRFVDGNPDSDPEDMTGELGAEGDTLFAVQDGFQLNDKTKWMTFTTSLQEKGFQPKILKRTWFNDLVGLYAYFKTETRKKFRDDQTNDPTVFLVTEIKEFPYELKPAAKGKPAPKGKAAASATAPAAAAVEPASESAEEIAAAILSKTLAPARKGVVIADIKRLKIEALMAISKHKPAVPAELKKAVQNQLGDDDWLEATGAAEGLFEILENGQVKFAD
jgi:hypothetical protein